jgi:hypothetical protein
MSSKAEIDDISKFFQGKAIEYGELPPTTHLAHPMDNVRIQKRQKPSSTRPSSTRPSSTRPSSNNKTKGGKKREEPYKRTTKRRTTKRRTTMKRK